MRYQLFSDSNIAAKPAMHSDFQQIFMQLIFRYAGPFLGRRES